MRDPDEREYTEEEKAELAQALADLVAEGGADRDDPPKVVPNRADRRREARKARRRK